MQAADRNKYFKWNLDNVHRSMAIAAEHITNYHANNQA